MNPCPKGVDEENICDLGYVCVPYNCGGCPAVIDPLSGTSICPDIWRNLINLMYDYKGPLEVDLILCPGSGREECPKTDICTSNPVWNDTTVGGCNVDACPAFCENGILPCKDYPLYDIGKCPRFPDYCLREFDDFGCKTNCPIDCPGNFCAL